MEQITVKGTVQLKVYKNDELIEDVVHNNLVVNLGKNNLARLLGSADSDRRVKKIAFGTSGAPVAATQTTLDNDFTKVLNGVTYSGTTASFEFELDNGENNGVTIREFGLKSDNDELFSRIVRNPIEKTNDIRLEGVWSITF